MASLDKIMNVDEEAPDPIHDKRSQLPSTRSTTHAPSSSQTPTPTSSRPSSSIDQHQYPRHPSTSSHQGHHSHHHHHHHHHNHSTSAHMAYSHTSETPSLSSPSSSTTSRRSQGSVGPGIDMMEPINYNQDQGYSYSPSGTYHDPSSRGGYPAGTAPGGGPPVKLTPITGRVSRAKKGMPVHVCEQCRPAKTFTRAEHLRRHQLSHNPPDLFCSVPGCGKVFYRKDLLERHQNKHEQESRAVLGSSPGSSASSYHSSGRRPSHGYATSSGRSYKASNVSMSSAPWSPDMDGADLPTSMAGSSSHPSGGSQILASPIGPYGAPDAGFGTVCLPHRPSSAWPDSSGMAPSSAAPNGHFPMSSAPEMGWSSAEQAPRTMGMIYAPYSAAPPIGSEGSYDYMDLMGMPSYATDAGVLSPHHHANTTVRSLTPMLAVGQSSETLVTAPPAPPLPQGPIESPSVCGSDSNPTIAAAEPHFLIATTARLSRAARTAIPNYLGVYWSRVSYPVIHRASFDELCRDGHPTPFELLKCAMGALATQYLEDKEHRACGYELQTFAWQELEPFTKDENWSLPVMQAVVCCEYYARFRGRDKQSYKPSARYRKLYQMLLDNHGNFNTFIPDGTNRMLAWKTWVAGETRRRLLVTCFMIDVHASSYFKESSAAPPGSDTVPFPVFQVPFSTNSNNLWEATDCDTWCRLAESEQLQSSSKPTRTLWDVLTPQDVASMTDFDATILMTGYAAQLRNLGGDMNNGSVENVFSGAYSPAARLAQLFPQSGVAYTYLALHFTPLHVLLSVSGNSWVLNKKILQEDLFREHRQRLDDWCRSEKAAVAASWASRALLNFLQLNNNNNTSTGAAGETVSSNTLRGMAPWKDVSDYWGVYICALICWAYGRGARRQSSSSSDSADSGNDASRETAVQWMWQASKLTTEQLMEWRLRASTRGVTCLVRDVLSRDCLGGRSILYGDAVDVLRRLGEGDYYYSAYYDL